MGWLGKIFGGAPGGEPAGGSDGVLDDALRQYPPYSPPVAGWGRDILDSDADANLDYLRDNLPLRLHTINALLLQSGIDTTALLDATADPMPAAREIDRWLDAMLPPRDALPQDKPPNPPRDLFVRCNRAGAHILFTLVTDLGLLEGEAVRIRHAAFAWTVDRERGHGSRMEYRRPCLLKPKEQGWDSQIIDHELSMLERVYAKRNGIAVHPFGYQIETLLRGGFDPAPVAR